MIRKILLGCGILAALLYVGSDIVAAMRWEGYSYTEQSVSELRAIGAPTRAFLVPLLFVYALLEIAFGTGVWATAAQRRRLRITGGLIIALGVLDLLAWFFPLDLGEAAGAFVNMLHVAATVVTVLLLLLIMVFGAMADGRWFRLYSIVTILVFVVMGVWSFAELPRIAANLPTPWLGVRERINIFSYMLWMAVSALVLWRDQAAAMISKPPGGVGTPHLAPR